LTDIVDIDQPTSTRSILTVACDVDNPLYGTEGAAYVFAPQKGANSEQVKLLDERLKAFAKETEEQGMATPEDAFHPGAGAAGGLGYALLTYLGAELKPGVDVVLDACGFDDVLKGGDVVITGEGCSDEQTTHGKVAAGVLKRAKQQGVKTVLMSGQIKEKDQLEAYGFDTLYGINEGEERPLSELMNPDVAKENIKKTCQRMMQEGI
jgi:glycerate kinase